MNEAHQPHADFTQKQIVDLTALAARSVREVDPAAVRIVNVNWPTGDYVVAPEVKPYVTAGKAQTPFQYLKALERAGVDYDVIGIQMYYPALDIMEISRLLDRFARLGKPIHITEVGASSATGIDKSSAFERDDLSVSLGEWHRPWDAATQADWVEQLYTVAYSKYAIEAISHWDMVDSFWPFGGLLDRDFEPKESYRRLKTLLARWGFAARATTR